MMHILILGNVVDGLGFIGPFESSVEAIEAGQAQDEEWCIAPLQDAETLLPADD